MKKEPYVAPVMEIVLLEREKTVLTSGCEDDCPEYCFGDECPKYCSEEQCLEDDWGFCHEDCVANENCPEYCNPYGDD